MKLYCKNNNAFLLVTFSVFYKNNCGLRSSLQNKHFENSGIIILWEPVLVFCLLLFLVFQTKEWQPHPVLILNTFFWLPPPQLGPLFPSGSCYTHAPSVFAVCGCRGNVTKLFGFTDDKGRTERFLVSTLTSGRSLCLALIFLATHTLPPLSD